MAVAEGLLGVVAAHEVAQCEETNGAEIFVGDDFGKEFVAVGVGAHVFEDRIPEGHFVAVIGKAFVVYFCVQKRHGFSAEHGGEVVDHGAIHAAIGGDDLGFGDVDESGVSVFC